MRRPRTQSWADAAREEHEAMGLAPNMPSPLMTKGRPCPDWFSDRGHWEKMRSAYFEALVRGAYADVV